MPDNSPKDDIFRDVLPLKNGNCVCVGQSGGVIIISELNTGGKLLWNKFYTNITQKTIGCSILLENNGDYIIGGARAGAPWIIRTDTIGTIKWATWIYDSLTKSQVVLSRNAIINSIHETKYGTIVCAAGDNFTDMNYIFGNTKYDYEAVLKFDLDGKMIYEGEAYGVAGFSAGGFWVDETVSGDLIVSGNQGIIYGDSGFKYQWKKNYTFMLDGVGAEVNNIVRCKSLRDGRCIVAGMAFEGNCWTKFKKLYYDAWWSPISLSGGLNTNWDTAGQQGYNDEIHDFTQLNNGNLAFIGGKGGVVEGGIWTFVTDSTGQKLLWEKQTAIPYLSNAGKTARGLAVRPTDDGGFIVAGDISLNDSLGGNNAIAAHFVPKPVSAAVVSRGNSALKSFNGFNVHVAGAKLIVINNSAIKNNGEAVLFNLTGKQIAAQTGKKEMVFDISHLSYGTYIVRLKVGAGIQTMKICL